MTLVKSVIVRVTTIWTQVSLVMASVIRILVIVSMSVTRIADAVGVALNAVLLSLEHDVVCSTS